MILQLMLFVMGVVILMDNNSMEFHGILGVTEN